MRPLTLHIIPEGCDRDAVPDHNPVDLAVRVARAYWDTSDFMHQLGETDELTRAVWGAWHDTHPGVGVPTLLCGDNYLPPASDSVEYGVRLGYALALTQDRQRDGWAAWVAAAEQELARSGCSLEAHLAPEMEWHRRHRDELRALLAGPRVVTAKPA